MLFSALLLLPGCDVTKPIPKGEYLLIKNKIKVQGGKFPKDELTSYIQQEPNKKLFGLFRSNIAFYNMGSKGKDTKFNRWLKNKVGRAPVLLDTMMINTSKKQMGLYIANKGHFNSTVTDSIEYHKKKATVTYIVKPSVPYTIQNICYEIADTVLAGFVFRDTVKSLIHIGRNYDSYLLDAERTRIVNEMRDQGYYHFSSSYIRFIIDSAYKTRKMDLTIEIRNLIVPSLDYLGTFTEARHARSKINKILIIPEYSLLQSDTMKYDTLAVTYKAKKHDTTGSTYYILRNTKLHLKPRTISQMIFIRSGSYFNRTDVSQTYSQLASLQIFNYMNIQFNETPGTGPESRDKLDCRILLSRVPVHSFTISTDGTNSAGAFGVQGNFIYQNRNLFRGGQLFKISLSGAASMQGNVGSDPHPGFFNTVEFGANTSLTFPQFLIPIRPEAFSKKFKPRTTISFGYNFQRKPDYDRHITNATFGYSWNQNEKLKHTLNPAEISFVKIFPDSSFTAYLNTLDDKRLKNQYTDHLVAGLRYTLTYSGQDVNTVKDFAYIRSNFETGGNLFYAINELANTPKTTTSYIVLGVPYSQFIRPDMDFRFYHFFNKTNSFVTRFYGGIAVPYGNSISVPFEKAFFAGGANDIRGWKMGSLGPGHYHNDTVGNSYDQTGDMQLQLDLEYRFQVWKQVRSALFMDIGNVWLIHNSPDLPGGQFDINYFIPDLAMDIGLGLRVDFDYFIIRLDPAVPIRVPYYFENNHWYVGKLGLSDIIWNFGIGYPF
ncbi:MAG: BamA/TamA family outer membrane protein [Bacteroidetes bacterium]|nr:BamA/TamA family outer membrane protein [Bacteroidota bacterium]